MEPAFLDSSAIFAIVDRDDLHHRRTLDAYRATRRLLTHSAVLLEAFSLVTKRIGKPVAIEVIEGFRASPRIECVTVDRRLLEDAWQRCLKFDDKEWDWIDCISFELMEQRGIHAALTIDQHFRQAGFRLLV